MIVELKKKNLVLSLLSIFKTKTKIIISITPENILIESIEIHKYYLSIPNTLFSCSETFEKFSINPIHLLNSLDLVSSDILEINSDLIKICTDTAFIKIPFISTISHIYEEVDDIYTKFVVDSKTIGIFSNLKGLVKYEIEDGKLFIRKIDREVIEEIEIKKMSFIETGELSFPCNNIWTDVVSPILNLVEKVLFLFGANILTVQFLFKNEEKIFLEIQIPKTLIEN
ncbi:DNA damage checkpoint control protein RAD17 [Vairimorpha necatrix]|uniref:DNA damage checkpoint control protein RAD17 n=1 Tax=Vairimorpha necatrix TaxID=6039 RepID=A0AAX4JDZ8_9MICR